MIGMIVANLVSLIPALVVAYGVVMGTVALITGWQCFSDRAPARYRRGVQVPPPDVTAQDPTGRDPGGIQ